MKIQYVYICSIMNMQQPRKHNFCTTSFQHLRRWSNIVQMLYKCFVFAGKKYILYHEMKLSLAYSTKGKMEHTSQQIEDNQGGYKWLIHLFLCGGLPLCHSGAQEIFNYRWTAHFHTHADMWQQIRDVAGLMLDQRPRRLANIDPSSGQRLLGCATGTSIVGNKCRHHHQLRCLIRRWLPIKHPMSIQCWSTTLGQHLNKTRYRVFREYINAAAKTLLSM